MGMDGNIFAGVLEGLGKALSGWGMGEMEQKRKLALQEKANEPYMQILGGMNPMQKTISSEDQKALAWAMANRSDPRAKAIFQKLGVGM